MNNLVSIITPSYNCSNYIDSCINSVINQTYTNWEMLIFDDCSTDDSYIKIQSFADADSRIKCFQNNQNIGAALTRNLAIKKANGKRTIPQIFVGDHHIGGNEQLQDVNRSGELDKILSS